MIQVLWKPVRSFCFQDATITLFESLRVTFEDVEEFLDDGLVDRVIVPDNDVVARHIAMNGDALLFRSCRFLVFRHTSLLRGIPASCSYFIRLPSNYQNQKASRGLNPREAFSLLVTRYFFFFVAFFAVFFTTFLATAFLAATFLTATFLATAFFFGAAAALAGATFTEVWICSCM